MSSTAFTLQRSQFQHYAANEECRSTNHNTLCEFPFEYDGVEYSGCTKHDEPGLWCSYTFDYDADRDWGWCDRRVCPTHDKGELIAASLFVISKEFWTVG